MHSTADQINWLSDELIFMKYPVFQLTEKFSKIHVLSGNILNDVQWRLPRMRYFKIEYKSLFITRRF